MEWIILVASIAIIIFIILVSDGKYFGKKLIYQVYNKFGPSMFNIRSEKDTWHSLYKQLNLKGNERILDVGTAMGDLPLSIASIDEFDGQVVGVDWSENMIRKAREKARIEGILGKVNFKAMNIVNEFHFEEKSFDVIFCLGLLETYSNSEQLLDKMIKILKPDGIMILSLYKSGVKIKLNWYKKFFIKKGFRSFKIYSYRKSMDFLVIQ